MTGTRGAARRYGYGTVYWQESTRRWVAAIELPRDADGRRRRKVFSATTRDAALQRLHDYRAAHPQKEYAGRRVYIERARRLGAHTDAEWWALVRRVGKRCYYCDVVTDPVWTPREHPLHTQRDHLIPVSRGGSDGIDNVVVSCRACNTEKGTMTVDEYQAWKAARHG